MSLLEKLLNRNSAKLRSHKVKQYPYFRLRYKCYESVTSTGHGQILWNAKDYVLTTYKQPNNMTREDMFKVISYVVNCVKEKQNKYIIDKNVIKETDKSLKSIGFKVPKKDECIDGVTDIYIVTGDLNYFKRSSNYKNYFKWYNKNVALNEVEKIYTNLGLNFDNNKLIDNIRVYNEDKLFN